VGAAPFATRLGTLTAIALLMTVGVYGLVAGIVKLDDAGAHLAARRGDGATDGALRALGRGLLAAAPRLMKALGVIGTVAMFLVGGGILTHAMHLVPGNLALALLADLAVGAVAGALALGAVLLAKRLTGGAKPAA
jgi:predicted DNA repair protein MutK